MVQWSWHRKWVVPRIVDLVETGSTLKANGLVELETIAQVSSRLVVNRTAWKQHPQIVDGWISRFRGAVRQALNSRDDTANRTE